MISFSEDIHDSKVHGTNMGSTWVMSAPDGPHVGPMSLVIRDGIEKSTTQPYDRMSSRFADAHIGY